VYFSGWFFPVTPKMDFSLMRVAPFAGERVESGGSTDLAQVAQLAEHVLGKDEVTGSIPVLGSRFIPTQTIPIPKWVNALLRGYRPLSENDLSGL